MTVAVAKDWAERHAIREKAFFDDCREARAVFLAGHEPAVLIGGYVVEIKCAEPLAVQWIVEALRGQVPA
jgi:hypothetical protein